MSKPNLPRTERYEIDPRKWVDVIRGDEIDGGLKRLAIEGVYDKEETTNLVFASNSHGLGPLALTLSLQGSNKHIIIFLSKYDNISANLKRCRLMGAELDFSGNASPHDSESLRKEAAAKYDDKQHVILPVGLNNAEVQANLAKIAREIFPLKPPKELWFTVASATTINGMRSALDNTKFHAVLVKHNNPDICEAVIHWPEEKFEESAKNMPPYSSNSEYDAKTWRIAQEYYRDRPTDGVPY